MNPFIILLVQGVICQSKRYFDRSCLNSFFVCVYKASFLLEEGCFPHELDQVMKVFGFPMGLFQTADLSGRYNESQGGGTQDFFW